MGCSLLWGLLLGPGCLDCPDILCTAVCLRLGWAGGLLKGAGKISLMLDRLALLHLHYCRRALEGAVPDAVFSPGEEARQE